MTPSPSGLSEPSFEDWIDAGCPEEIEHEGMFYGYDFLCSELGFCGCGWAARAAAARAAMWLRDVLVRLKVRGHYSDMGRWMECPIDYAHGPLDSKDLPEGLFWLLWYWIDDKGLVEHGTNVRGSWLTPKGERWLRGLSAFICLEAACGQ